MRFDLLRTSLFAAVLIAFVGYLCVFRPLESTIADRYAQLDAARATLERSLGLAHRIPALARERAALDTQLMRLHLREQRAASVERFLRAISGVAARNQIAVESVSADARQASYAPARSAQPALFDEVPLSVTLRGRYGDVIRAARELNSEDFATRLTLASLSDADRRAGERPQLNATFHVLLLREADESTTHDARPR
jgi:hypothetical protein